jgi:hypothetical protein
LRIVARFGFGRRNVSDRLQQSAIVEPVHPFERVAFDLPQAAPRPASPDHLGFVEPVDRLDERIASRDEQNIVVTPPWATNPNLRTQRGLFTLHAVRLDANEK